MCDALDFALSLIKFNAKSDVQKQKDTEIFKNPSSIFKNREKNES